MPPFHKQPIIAGCCCVRFATVVLVVARRQKAKRSGQAMAPLQRLSLAACKHDLLYSLSHVSHTSGGVQRGVTFCP